MESNKNDKESNKVAKAWKNVASVLGVVSAKNSDDKNDAPDVVEENDLNSTSNADEMNLTFISATSQLPSEKMKNSTDKSSHLSPLNENDKKCDNNNGATGSTKIQLLRLNKMKNNDLLDQGSDPKPFSTNAQSKINKQEPIGSKNNLTSSSEPLSSLSTSSSTNVKKTPIDPLKKGKISSEVMSSPATAPLSKKKTSAPSSGSRGWSLKNFITKRLNPDATTADVGDSMEAYYCPKLKRWVFPGDDPAELAEPLAPPPITSLKKTNSKEPLETAATPSAKMNDPLANLMAPPTRSRSAHRSTLKTPSTTKAYIPPARPGTSTSRLKGEQHTGAAKPVPQFTIFQAPKETAKVKEKSKKIFTRQHDRRLSILPSAPGRLQ